MVHKFKVGGMWEFSEFQIITNVTVTSNSGGSMCKHCHSKQTITKQTAYDGSTYQEISWKCPKVVVALNEGGHNSTGVCLDCIIEASKKCK